MGALITVKFLPWIFGVLGFFALALGWQKVFKKSADLDAAKGRVDTLKEMQGINNASSALDDDSLVDRLSDKP